MFYVYILQSNRNGSYYIGCTDDITRRLSEHNMGKVKSTKAYKPWLLQYTEKYNTLSEARKREKQIKHWKSRTAIERLLKKL
ncbi:MAG: GIY-YIG nuclease family protein [bacterium]|nr:GIY-YIG nuclease family protein [bacterium]